LIIYGVFAAKNDDKIDCATKRLPIADIERFQNEVVRAVGQLLMPRHDGIQVAGIPSAESPGAGYLAIYIERSERRPHRSEVRGDKQYYKRAGESTFAMEHYDIEDAFKRITIAKLTLEWRLSKGGHSEKGDGSGHTDVNLILILSNNSSTTARFPYLHIRLADLFSHITGPKMQGHLSFAVRAIDEWRCLEGGVDNVINPGIALPIVIAVLRLPLLPHSDPPSPVFFSLKDSAIDYRYGCEHSPVQSGSINVSVAELMNLYQTQGG
jgi:hypothetical protein